MRNTRNIPVICLQVCLIDYVSCFINHSNQFAILYLLVVCFTYNGVIDASGKQTLIGRSGFGEIDALLSDLIRL